MNANVLVDVQTRLLESLHVWYPDLCHGSVSLVHVQEKRFRWSRHLVFEVINERGLSGPMILAKISRSRDTSGRTQDEAGRSSNALMLEYRALSLLYEHLGGNENEGITAVRPLTYFSDIDALVVEYMPGRNFLVLILDAARPWGKRSVLQDAVDAVYRAGRLLGAIHQIKLEGYPREEPFDSDKYHQRLQDKVERLLSLVSGEYVRRRLVLIQQAAHELGLQETVIMNHLHRDLYPENLVHLPDGRVYTVDTTLHQVGPVEEDIAKFLVGVDTLKQRLLFGCVTIRSDAVDAIERSFLAGYCTRARFSPRILVLFRLLALTQRWIEVLSVLARKAPIAIASAIQRARINPFMLACLDSIWVDLQ